MTAWECCKRLDDLVDTVCTRLRDELPADETDQRYRQGMLDIRGFQRQASQLLSQVDQEDRRTPYDWRAVNPSEGERG